MNKLSVLTTLAYVKGSMAVDKIMSDIETFDKDERGVEGFVVALILVGIAAILAAIFRDSIKEIMESLIQKIKELLDLN